MAMLDVCKKPSFKCFWKILHEASLSCYVGIIFKNAFLNPNDSLADSGL